MKTILLEDFLDDELQEKIRHNPSAESYTIHVQEVADYIRKLKNNGLKKCHSCDSVILCGDSSIFFIFCTRTKKYKTKLIIKII